MSNWRSWLREAPGFNIQEVRAPLRIEAVSGVAAVLSEWEFYAGLRRSGKPVDLIAYPGGIHSLIKPSQRLASTEGTLDWIDYWINGRVDSAQQKASQYVLWDAMSRSICESRSGDTALPARAEAIGDTCRTTGVRVLKSDTLYDSARRY